MASRRENERILKSLKTSRTYIEKMWVKGEWVAFRDDDNDDNDDPINPPAPGPVVGVCAAGSVLYSMGYTSEQWTEQPKVKPVIEALFNALPKACAPKRLADAWITEMLNDQKESPLYFTQDVTNKRAYEYKVEAITTYNDAKHRRKQDVIDLFDRAIETVQRSIAPVIQEATL